MKSIGMVQQKKSLENKKEILNRLLLIVLIITPLIIIPYSSDYFYFPKIYFVYIISAIMLVIWFLNREGNKPDFNSVEKPVICYLFIVIISTVFSVNHIISLYGNFRREEGLFAIIVYIYLYIVANRNYIFSEKPVKFLLFSATIIAVYGVFQYFGFDPVPRDLERINWSKRAFATMGNPDFLGSYLVLILPISVFAYFYARKNIYLLTSGLIYLSLLCTMTRSAWLGALFSIAVLTVYSVIYGLGKKHIAILLVIFVIITIVMNNISSGKVIGRFFTIGLDFKKIVNQAPDYQKAGAGRVFIWERVLKLISQRPLFGYGLETLGIVFTERFYCDVVERYNRVIIFDKAHNEYLHIAVTTGVPALMAYLYFVLNIVIKAIKNVGKNIMIIPLLCSVIGYLVQAFFNISVVSVAYVYWIALGMLSNITIGVENV
ncbi:MAG: O-antigen ligase family protein [Natronincolaceae bacterium]|jgi:O-antigen ligase